MYGVEYEDQPESGLVGNRGRRVTGISGHGKGGAASPRRITDRVYPE